MAIPYDIRWHTIHVSALKIRPLLGHLRVCNVSILHPWNVTLTRINQVLIQQFHILRRHGLLPLSATWHRINLGLVWEKTDFRLDHELRLQRHQSDWDQRECVQLRGQRIQDIQVCGAGGQTLPQLEAAAGAPDLPAAQNEVQGAGTEDWLTGGRWYWVGQGESHV